MKSKQPQLRLDNSVLQATAIIIVSLLVSCSILLVSGALNSIYDNAVSLLPRFANYGTFKNISNYQNTFEVISSQPKISYNSNSKLLFVETSDMNCVNCANFHGYNASGDNYTYKKLQRDFVEKGQIDYVFIDTIIFDSVEKHNSTYCVAEQNTRAFFEYKEKVYKAYNQTFNLDLAKTFANGLNLDMGKFEQCYNSRKYESRINSLNTFTQNNLGTSSTPTFHVFKVQDKEVTRADGSKVMEKEYTKLTSIVGNQDYDLFIKPQLERLVRENR